MQIQSRDPISVQLRSNYLDPIKIQIRSWGRRSWVYRVGDYPITFYQSFSAIKCKKPLVFDSNGLGNASSFRFYQALLIFFLSKICSTFAVSFYLQVLKLLFLLLQNFSAHFSTKSCRRKSQKSSLGIFSHSRLEKSKFLNEILDSRALWIFPSF